MSLRADSIDRNTLGEPLVDLFDHAPGDLGVVCNVEVIVVDVKLGIRVSGACSAERDANEVLAENAAEDAVAEGAVLGEDLVDDVPVEDLALVARDHCGDVVLDDLGQGVAVVDVLHPLRELGVPDEGVAADLLAVGLGEVDNGICVREVKLVPARYVARVSFYQLRSEEEWKRGEAHVRWHPTSCCSHG